MGNSGILFDVLFLKRGKTYSEGKTNWWCLKQYSRISWWSKDVLGTSFVWAYFSWCLPCPGPAQTAWLHQATGQVEKLCSDAAEIAPLLLRGLTAKGWHVRGKGRQICIFRRNQTYTQINCVTLKLTQFTFIIKSNYRVSNKLLFLVFYCLLQ